LWFLDAIEPSILDINIIISGISNKFYLVANRPPE
jgi:hypothetical protein